MNSRTQLLLLLILVVPLSACSPSQPPAEPANLPPPADCFQAITRVPPMYPAAAIESGTEGRVMMEGTLTRDGRVIDVKVLESDPPGVFDAVSVRAFEQWVYPARRPGEPDCPNPIQIAIPFRLNPR